MNEPNEAGGKHYGQGLQPWDLQRHMQTWGSVFIDARRTDTMEYLFRKKGDKSKQLDDARKALHNVQEIIKELENTPKMLDATDLDDEKKLCPIRHDSANLQFSVTHSIGHYCLICGGPWK